MYNLLCNALWSKYLLTCELLIESGLEDVLYYLCCVLLVTKEALQLLNFL